MLEPSLLLSTPFVFMPSLTSEFCCYAKILDLPHCLQSLPMGFSCSQMLEPPAAAGFVADEQRQGSTLTAMTVIAVHGPRRAQAIANCLAPEVTVLFSLCWPISLSFPKSHPPLFHVIVQRRFSFTSRDGR